MLLRLLYNDYLAHAAYLVGCQRTGEALVVDPGRDVDRYTREAARHGLRVTAVTETHIHADFLSGARELAEKTGARLYLSDEGDADWKYGWLDSRSDGGSYDHVLLHDGDTFEVGLIELRAMHTPGHTPEHLSFVITDKGGGAQEPMGALTGDFVFVGDMGRPDLLETAAGLSGVKEASALALGRSAQRFLDLPDYLQVWPAHGAGSACGKALGAVPQSTVGYERRQNPALGLAADPAAFSAFILEGQPEPPLYFGRMKVQNRDGVPLLGEMPSPVELGAGELANDALDGRAIVDTRPWKEFRAGHLPGALFAPFDGAFHGVVGSYLKPDDDIVVVAEPEQVETAVRELVRIGLDRVAAFVTPETLRGDGVALDTAPEVDVTALRDALTAGEATVLDVRRRAELSSGTLSDKDINVAHTRLPEHVDSLPRNGRLFVYCATGRRSAFATAYLRKMGFDAVNVAGGIAEWWRRAATR
jgi:hydroxyacylglutathione hydrolase